MNVLIDTNVLLDVILQRKTWFTEARDVWSACENGLLRGYIPAVAMTNIFFIVRRSEDLGRAFSAVDQCLRVFTILPTDRNTLEQARLLPGNDFEDNVQIASAIIARLDAVVTRDPAGFKQAPLPVLSPQQLLAQL